MRKGLLMAVKKGASGKDAKIIDNSLSNIASREELLEYYRQMLLIRRFEEKAGQLYGCLLYTSRCV